jgi:hypothetical protein
MGTPAEALRAELSLRIRLGAPPEWREFSNLWMAFNAMYGGELGGKERARLMASIRKHFSEKAALRVLRASTPAIDQVLALSPGNMRLDRLDPAFRAASQRCAALYRNQKETAVGRLAGVAGVVYQVRCNLLHGSKDPRSDRDRMLVRESVRILQALVPELESEIAS